MKRELMGTVAWVVAAWVVAWVTQFPCVCLGLPGQVNKLNSNRPFLAVIETA